MNAARSQKSRGRVVLVTGAGAGIGRALCLRLLGRGHTVLAGVRDLERATRDLAELADHPRGEIVRLDVNVQADVGAVISAAEARHGRIDVLVNNAGYGLYGAFETLPEDEFRAQLETNLYGAMRMARAVLPLMRRQGAGSILNISSILGRLVLPTGSAYTASKWALEAFSESLRYEVRPFGVYVSAIEPGLIRTNFKDNMHIVPEDPNVPAERYQTYRFLNSAVGRDYTGFATSAEAAARRIARIAEQRRPAVRYRVGLDSHIYDVLRRVLPERVFDWLLRLGVWFLWRKRQTT